MDTKEVFDVIPEIEELINFSQFEVDIEIPLESGLINFRLAMLWEGEDYEIVKKSGEKHNPLDMLSRGRYMKIETLVYAIKKIGAQEFTFQDKDKHEIAKNNLRIILYKLNPYIIEELWWRYTELLRYVKVYVDEKMEDSKKKFQMTLQELKPL